MFSPKQLWPWRGCCLAAFFLTTCSGFAPGKTAAAAPVPPQAVEIIYASGSPSSILPGKATLFTTWITPLGRRDELPSGKATFLRWHSPLAYALDPRTKQATSEPAVEERADPDQAWGQNVVGKVTVSHQSLLGYRCLVRKGTLRVGGILASAEDWVATVSGQRVALKTRIESGGNLIVFVEAVAVRALPKAPPGLLDVPAGYTITPQSAATEEKGTPSALSAQVK